MALYPNVRYMQIVASLTDPSEAAGAQADGATMLELRLDLMEGDPAGIARECKNACTLPVIATYRSAQEGGRYFGSPEEWQERIAPVIPYVEYVDAERRFAAQAAIVRAAGKKIIASVHEQQMPSLPELFACERELMTYGDIPKIIVTPGDEDDLVNLVSFTRAAHKPICTGVMGARFRYARAILPLFGSELVYCHTGRPTAAGQYSVAEFVALARMLA